MNSSLMLSKWGRYLGKKLMKSRQANKPKPNDPHNHWNIVTGDKVEVDDWHQIEMIGSIFVFCGVKMRYK